MTPTEHDARAAVKSIKMLSLSMFEILSEPDQKPSSELTGGLGRLYDQLEALAWDWRARISDPAQLPAEILMTGSHRLIATMQSASALRLPDQPSRIFTLVRTYAPETLELAVAKGLDPAPLIIPLSDGLTGRKECAPRDPAHLEGHQALLERLARAAPARDDFDKCSWSTIQAYNRDPKAKLALLKMQIDAFPDHFSDLATALSRVPRKCAPLLLIALSGARIRGLAPDTDPSVRSQRMRVLCDRLGSAHGRLELLRIFSPLDELVPDIQSRLDAFLHTNGAPTS